jgi:hypothetical protein
MTASTHHADHGIDALLPAEIAEKAEAVGVLKARLDVVSLLALAILAGAFIALGAMFATTVLAGADGVLPFGVSRLLAGVAFCLGLVLVVLGGAELFTGNTLMVMAWAAGKMRLRVMLRAWLIVYIGNFVGAVGTALLVFLSGQYLAGHGASPPLPSNSPSTKRPCPLAKRCFSASCATSWSASRCGCHSGRGQRATRCSPFCSRYRPSSPLASSIRSPICISYPSVYS